MSIFSGAPTFCSDCGTILPLIEEAGNVVCYICKREYPFEVFENSEISYTIMFNDVDVYEKNAKEKEAQKEEESGPTIERKCPKCGNEKMTYAALQLRSADEGQTVFYTCTKCKYKENENS